MINLFYHSVIMNDKLTRHYFELSYPDQKLEVYVGELLIASTVQPVLLKEAGMKLYDPVYHLPREDVKMDFFLPSPTKTQCPIKGEAVYYSLKNGNKTLTDIAWSYETTEPGAEVIHNKIAFSDDRVILRLIPNPRQL